MTFFWYAAAGLKNIWANFDQYTLPNSTVVLMMTAYGTVETAVEAMREGVRQHGPVRAGLYSMLRDRTA